MPVVRAKSLNRTKNRTLVTCRLSNINKTAYFYTACKVCVTILVLAGNSGRFQILHSYSSHPSLSTLAWMNGYLTSLINAWPKHFTDVYTVEYWLRNKAAISHKIVPINYLIANLSLETCTWWSHVTFNKSNHSLRSGHVTSPQFLCTWYMYY